MDIIKHSKFKNSGILFEILVRRITADALSGNESPASNILKKYFVNTEIGKEYKLYETLFKYKNINESKANTIISTILESSKKLNRSKLRKEKYNLIKELKEYYNLEELFKTKISDYRSYASLYNLIEIHNSIDNINPTQIVNNKLTLIEHLTQVSKDKEAVKNDTLEEFKSYDKGLRILTYKILLEKFNSKYSELNERQKYVLKEFINSIDSTPHLREFYNNEIKFIKTNLKESIEKKNYQTIKIKLNEVYKLIGELNKNHVVKNDDLVNLLQYHELLEELNKTK